MAVLRSILFTIIFYGLSVPYVVIALLVGIIDRRALIYVALLWGRFFVGCARWLLDIHIKVEGKLPEGPVLVALKHEAMFETLCAIPLFGKPAVVMKAELGRIPLWGWTAQRYGIIPVDRTAGAAAMRAMLGAAKAAVAAGRPILIFPEGTRVPPGETPPLRAGFAGLYKMLKQPVVPIALDSGSVWPKGFVKRAGTVTFRVGPTIPPGLPRDEAEALVHEAINALNASPAARG